VIKWRVGKLLFIRALVVRMAGVQSTDPGRHTAATKRGQLHKQRGVALISVLLIVAILMALTTRLLSGHQLVVQRHQNTFGQNQALQYALGAEDLARQVLFKDQQLSGEIDHLEEIWSQPITPFAIDESGFIEIRLRDLHGCFNLNSLTIQDKAKADRARTRLLLLLQNLGVNPGIIDPLMDWTDADSEPRASGAEDDNYLNRIPPYRTANQPLYDVSELYLLEGVERDEIALLLPHVCVIPDSDVKVNINTAKAEVIAALDNTIGIAVAEGIVGVERRYQNVDELIQSYDVFTAIKEDITVQSRYFELHVRVTVNDSTVTLRSTLERESGGTIRLLQRNFGKLFQMQTLFESDLQDDV